MNTNLKMIGNAEQAQLNGLFFVMRSRRGYYQIMRLVGGFRSEIGNRESAYGSQLYPIIVCKSLMKSGWNLKLGAFLVFELLIHNLLKLWIPSRRILTKHLSGIGPVY